jgi:predicted small lipoprotein YifL
MRKLTFSTHMIGVAALLALTGCASAGPLAQKDGAAAAPQFEQGYKRLPIKKGGSGVALTYQLEGTPEVGKPLLVKMLMVSPADAQVVVRAGEGLQLPTAEVVMQSTAGVPAEHQMSVVPKALGRFYLHVMSTANGRTSASAIAVQVGTDKDMPQAKPSGDIKTMPNGERVISLPAQ